jgi:8-oxo-dGTP diphosphatase
LTIFRAEYCPDCGQKLVIQGGEDGDQPYCEACDRTIWQQPIPCTDVVIVDGKRILLIKRDNPPHVGKWALPGGIIDINESPEEAAARELKEETGVSVDPTDLRLLGTYDIAASEGWHNIGITYVVAKAKTQGEPASSSDAQEARFWTLDELQQSDQEIRPTPDDESRIKRATHIIDAQ